MKDYDAIAAKFEELHVESFGADLPNGKIHWTNSAGERVAQGDCKVTISFAGTNNSYIWMSTMAQYKDVPKIPLPAGMPKYVESTTEERARNIATSAAAKDGADYLYAAPVGGGGFVYIAVYKLVFTVEKDTPEEEAAKKKAAWSFLADKIEMLIDAIDVNDFPKIFDAFIADARNQAKYVLFGLSEANSVGAFTTKLEEAWKKNDRANMLGVLRNAHAEALGEAEAIKE